LKKLQSLQEKLTNELMFHAHGRQSDCWPSLGNILLLQQIGSMHSVTDFRHCIIQPTQLLIAQCLIQCPISSIHDLSCGILLSCILCNYLQSTHERIPELVVFAHRAIDFLISTNQKSTWPEVPVSGTLQWTLFSPTASIHDHYNSVLFSVLRVTDAILQNYHHESTIDIIRKVQQLLPSSTITRLKEFENLSEVYSQHLGLSHLSPRKSLSWRPTKKVVEEMLTPAYEVDYKMKTTIQCVNPEKVKLKVLNKQLKREQKASMRELRRDSEFLDQEHFVEKSKNLSEKKAERFQNYSWLEQEQATFNQQVRKNDKDALKGGGSGGVPKKKQKRRK
jgi:hypothetical protein